MVPLLHLVPTTLFPSPFPMHCVRCMSVVTHVHYGSRIDFFLNSRLAVVLGMAVVFYMYYVRPRPRWAAAAVVATHAIYVLYMVRCV